MVEVNDYPLNYAKIKKVFNPPETVCFTYGDKLFNPTGNKISADVFQHESVHERQQKELGAEAWWNKYLTDKDFRLDQELEAYAVQYNWIKETTTTKTAKQFLDLFARTLSTIYKLDLDFNKAYTAIRLRAKCL